ncbi:Uncharacterized protein APZ42_028467 [Daphnia magna]|uniref:Uncharacterized protein n=1 Tax=Daphnia magna TaxID=35525 RepID=A0A164QHN8_9CRUS|nr:Uncharacterized protein APZ42_028467 [Daphnia magna]
MSTKIFTDIAVFDDVVFSNFQSIFLKYPSSLHRDSNLGSFASPSNRLTITSINYGIFLTISIFQKTKIS